VATGAASAPDSPLRTDRATDRATDSDRRATRGGDPRFSRFGIVNRKAVQDFAAEQIAAFDIKAAGPEARTSTLSGGNLQKALLARERAFAPLVLCGGLVILAGANMAEFLRTTKRTEFKYLKTVF